MKNWVSFVVIWKELSSKIREAKCLKTLSLMKLERASVTEKTSAQRVGTPEIQYIRVSYKYWHRFPLTFARRKCHYLWDTLISVGIVFTFCILATFTRPLTHSMGMQWVSRNRKWICHLQFASHPMQYDWIWTQGIYGLGGTLKIFTDDFLRPLAAAWYNIVMLLVIRWG